MLEIYGTKGSVFLGQNLQIVTEEGISEESVTFPDYYSGLLENFYECVASDAEPLAPGIDGLRNIEAIGAAYRSAREGITISL